MTTSLVKNPDLLNSQPKILKAALMSLSAAKLTSILGDDSIQKALAQIEVQRLAEESGNSHGPLPDLHEDGTLLEYLKDTPEVCQDNMIKKV